MIELQETKGGYHVFDGEKYIGRVRRAGTRWWASAWDAQAGAIGIGDFRLRREAIAALKRAAR